MKKISVIILSIMILFVGCKESTTEPGPDPINDKYYVIKDGASFVYSLSITDTNNTTINGNHYLIFDDSTVIGGTAYKIQVDSFETLSLFDTLSTSVISYIRESNGGVYTYADTTGFTGFLPDSLRQYLSVDRESRLLFYPLSVNQKYPVFTLTLSQFIFGISVIDVDAIVQSSENINLNVNNTSTDFNAFKIKYTFIIRPSSTDSLYYSAYGWVVKDLGFVKWEGDSEVFNFLFNENIFPPATTIKMDIKNYTIP
jgi:hypothetical protein